MIVPEDVQEAEHQEPSRAHGAVFSSLGFSEPAVRPRDEDHKHAAEVLNSAGLHVAQVMTMAPEHGSHGYRDGPPEEPYYQNLPEPAAKLRARRIATVAALAGACAAGAMLLLRAKHD